MHLKRPQFSLLILKLVELLVQTFQKVQARLPPLCEQTEGQPRYLCPCFKVVLVCVDRRVLEFYSKIGFECLHWLPQWQRGPAPPTTADHRRQPAVSTPQVSPASNSRQSNTRGTCIMSPACLRGNQDEDQSRETKVIAANKDVPKGRGISRMSRVKVKNLSAA